MFIGFILWEHIQSWWTQRSFPIFIPNVQFYLCVKWQESQTCQPPGGQPIKPKEWSSPHHPSHHQLQPPHSFSSLPFRNAETASFHHTPQSFHHPDYVSHPHQPAEQPIATPGPTSTPVTQPARGERGRWVGSANWSARVSILRRPQHSEHSPSYSTSQPRPYSDRRRYFDA